MHLPVHLERLGQEELDLKGQSQSLKKNQLERNERETHVSVGEVKVEGRGRD